MVKARLAPRFPLSLMLGGFEHQCVQTARALAAVGCDASLLDWNTANDEYDVLHLFGATSAWHDICAQSRDRHGLVISVLGGGDGRHTLLSLANTLGALACGLIPRQQTDFQRRRRMLLMADRLICVNELGRAFVAKHFGLPRERIAVVPHGVPASRFKGEASLFEKRYGLKDYVLFVGNIVTRKNPLLLAQVLGKRGWEGVFIGGVVGSEATYARRFETFVRDTPNIRWIRGLVYDDPLLDSAYAGARVLCLPSRSETQPLSAMEAMAAGVPVVLGDFPYAHQPPFDKTVKCRPLKPKALIRCLEEVLTSPERYRTSLPERYLWKAVAKHILAVYEEVLAERGT